MERFGFGRYDGTEPEGSWSDMESEWYDERGR